MEGLVVRRIHPDEIRDASRHDVAEEAEARSQHRVVLELPRDRRSGLKNRERSRCEESSKVSLNRIAQRLVHIVRDGIERTLESRDLVVRVQRIGVEGIAYTDRPGYGRCNFPGVLCIEIQVQEVERLVTRCGEGLSCCRGNTVNELRQGGVVHRRDGALAEVVIIQAKDSDVRAEPEFVGAATPSEIVIDEEPRRAPALNPIVIESANRGERCVRAAAFEDDWKSSQRLLQIAWLEKTFVPREGWIEVVHQVLREDVGVSSGEGV